MDRDLRGVGEPRSEDKRFSYSCASAGGWTPNYHASSTDDRALPNSRALTPPGATRGRARRHSSARYARHSEPQLRTSVIEGAWLCSVGRLHFGFEPPSAQPKSQSSRDGHNRSFAAGAGCQALEALAQRLVLAAAHRSPRALDQPGAQRTGTAFARLTTMHDCPRAVL